MNIFEFKDYRDLIRGCAEERKSRQSDYTFAQLAKAMQVQAPYLSRVFSKDADLNTDQLFLACLHFELKESETEFANVLLELARSTIPTRKIKLREKLSKILDSQKNTRNHLKAQFFDPDESLKYQEYYLEPLASVVHMCLMIPTYQGINSGLDRLLNIPTRRLDAIIESLETMKIIEFNKRTNKWTVRLQHLQLDQASRLSKTNHHLMRHTSIEHMQRLPDNEKFEFNVTFSADEETRAVIRNEFNKFLSHIENAVRAAPSEIVCQLNFDLFRWDGNQI